MSNIVKIEDLSPALSEQEKKIVLADGSARIRTLEAPKIAKDLINYIGEAYVILGHSRKATDKDIAIMSKLVTDKLKEKFPNYKIEEVWHAIRNGAFGEYDDEIVYLSARNIVSWCTKYQKNKSEVLLKQMKHKERLTKAQEEAIAKEKSIIYWQELPDKIEADYVAHVHNEELSPSYWLYFGNLEQLKIIDIPNKEKLAFFNDVKDSVEQKARENYTRIDENSILNVVQNKCRLHYYKNYFDNVEDWSKEREKIKRAIASNELF